MTNTQFGFDIAISSCSPYGIGIDFTVPTGIATIASKTGAGGWCTAGNILAYDSSGNYVECSITYAYNISGLTRGWYFWYGYNGTGTYVALSADPTSDSVTLSLLYNGTNWIAFLTDHTNSSNNHSKSFSSSIAGYVIKSGDIWFENGGDTNCCDYSSTFGGMTFSNLTFYNQSGGTITCSASVTGLVPGNHNQPTSNCANTKSICITETVNTSTYVLATNG
ncbi:MAG: hypothetical protein KGI33_08715 [Thaumarchaeota archaeon]|nr:hypothetical protein [Nitrososphaerota archaeon]